MKKFFALLSVLLIVLNPVATYAITKGVTVSAIVGNINVPAVITITNPDNLNTGTTKYVARNGSVTIDFDITDTDSVGIYYTIAPSEGSVSVETGGPANPPFSRQFSYIAPATIPVSGNNQTITIAANDGTSVSSKIIKIYIY